MPAVNVTEDTFDEEVTHSDVPVLVDLWAPWCAPCKALAPHLDALADSGKNLKVAKINVEDEMGLAHALGVSSLPTLLVFKGGKVVGKKIGAAGGLAALEQFVSPMLDTE